LHRSNFFTDILKSEEKDEIVLWSSIEGLHYLKKTSILKKHEDKIISGYNAFWGGCTPLFLGLLQIGNEIIS
jgi:hypothetical protein